MGGVIFIFLVALVIVILIMPAVRAEMDKRRRARQGAPETAHEVVIRRLDDARARRANKPPAKPDEPGPDA